MVGTNGDRWQFKTGHDQMQDYRIGDDVPYRKNEDLAMDIEWPDGVYDGANERDDTDARDAWIVIKDHKLAAIVQKCAYSYLQTVGMYAIREPHLDDWSADARLAYHLKEAESLKGHIERRTAIGVELKDPDWYKKPGASMHWKIREESLMRKILPPAEVKT